MSIIYDLRENEHQELFYPEIDPTHPIEIHIPSPLGPLGYFLFVRVPVKEADRLGSISARLDIDGLREDHLTVPAGDGVEGDPIIASTVKGLAWRCLCKAPVSRGNGVLVLNDWPSDLTQADLLICTWPRFVRSGQADAWLAAQADADWAPSGVPLGGIGGGRVDICRDGRFRNFSMNNNQDAPVEDPDGLAGAYLAVTMNGKTVDLASRPIVTGHDCCAPGYQAAFPQAVLKAEPHPGIAVTVTLSGTLCPHDLHRSSIPGFLIRWEVANISPTEQTVECSLGWPNLIGVGGLVAGAESGIGYGDGFYRHWNDATGRAQESVSGEGYAGIRYTGNPGEGFLSSDGEHLLAVSTQAGDVSASEGVLSVRLTIPAGRSSSATMALLAAMPHWVDSYGVDQGAYWQNHFQAGEEMLAVLLGEADGILRETGALSGLLHDSTLPDWLRARLANCTYPLVTNSVHYRDGRFSINEGPTEMAGCYGTIDQRLAAHPATYFLFPELNAVELGLFARIQGDNGGIRHDLGGGHLERPAGENTWPDLTCSFIIQTARHAWSTGDAAFAQAMWPHARRALLRHAEWAEAGGGVAQVGHGLGTSYDGYHYVGTTGYMATLWLATLAVGEQWAAENCDEELLGKIPAWREAAVTRLNEDLWNGRHFIAYAEKGGVRRDTCHAGQLAGQVFAQLLPGRDVLDRAQLRSCLDAIFALNGSERFAVPPDEATPQGEAATAFGWLPYIEGFMLTAAASLGDARLWPVWERMIAAVDADASRPCDTRLMYRPDGSPSWGAYYMTAPASWLVYDAWFDFAYTPAAGALRLRAVPGRYPIVHPLFWATADITEDGAVTLTIRRTFTAQPLELRALAVPSGITVKMSDQLPITGEQGNYALAQLPASILLEPETTVRWQVISKTSIQ